MQQELTFEDSGLPQRLLRSFDECRRQQKFCDVTIETRSGPISCHRLVLASASRRLDRLLSPASDQSIPSKLDFRSLDGQAVDSALDFAYTGKLEITSGNCRSVASVARALEMNSVLEVCVSFCKQNMNVSTCLTTRQLAKELQLPDLIAFCDNFLSNVSESDKEELMQLEAFPRLPRLRFELDIAEEIQLDPDELASAAIGFLQDKFVGSLTPYVEEVTKLTVGADNRLPDAQSDGQTGTPLTSPNRHFTARRGSRNEIPSRSAARKLMLDDQTGSGDTVTVDSDECESDDGWKVLTLLSRQDGVLTSLVVLDDQLATLSISTLDRKSRSSSPLQCPRSNSCSSSGCSSVGVQFLASLHTARCSMGGCVLSGHICAVGGYNRSDCLSTMEMYDPESNTWSVATPMNSRRGRCSAASLNGCIYCFGGSDGHNVLKSAEMFDVTKKVWQSIPSMNMPRSRLSSVVLDGSIYVIGGASSSKDPLRTVEKYNPVTNTWMKVPSLCEPRTDASATVLGGNIYVVGGSNQWNSLSSVECFDPAVGKWKVLPSLQTPRRGAGVVSLNEKVYVVGGHSSTHSLDSMEIYDPITQKWSYSSPMSTPRANIAAVVVDGLLFAVGGFDGSTFLNTLEYFNPNDGKWHLFTSV